MRPFQYFPPHKSGDLCKKHHLPSGEGAAVSPIESAAPQGGAALARLAGQAQGLPSKPSGPSSGLFQRIYSQKQRRKRVPSSTFRQLCDIHGAKQPPASAPVFARPVHPEDRSRPEYPSVFAKRGSRSQPAHPEKSTETSILSQKPMQQKISFD